MSTPSIDSINKQFKVTSDNIKRERQKVTCLNCNRYTIRRNASRMKDHLLKCPSVQPNVRQLVPLNGSVSSSGPVSMANRILKLTSNELDELTHSLIMFIYTTSTPFCAVENKHLKDLFRKIGLPTSFLPSRKEIATTLLRRCFERIKNVNTKAMDGKWYWSLKGY